MMRLDPNMLGVVATIHRRMDEIIEMIKSLSEEVKEIRQGGVSINFQVDTDEEESESEEDDSGEGDNESSDSASTWP